jgi:dTMP kinase
MTTKPGRFLVFEGIDGAGTTTQARALVSWLGARGIPAVYTCEPSEGPIGSMLRNALRGRVVPGTVPGVLDPRVIALLFAADRLDHVLYDIRPSLDKGFWVICDRFVTSSLAYQGLDLPEDWLATLNREAGTPDLTIYLRMDPAVAMARLGKSRARLDHFEALDKLQRIEANYRRLEAQGAMGTEVLGLDGTLPVESLAEAIQARVLATSW